jgi:hypothetical protein
LDGLIACCEKVKTFKAGEMHRSSGCYTPPYLENKKIIQKKFKKIEFEDEYWYCTYKNISLGNYFYFILGKKTNSKRPMTKYYSLYICHFFCIGYNKN